MKFSVFSILLVFAFINANSQDALNLKHFNSGKNKVAVEGYDVVSYFNGKPLEGDKKINSTFQGITYYFSNASNKDSFIKNPEKYAPAFGGWCAYAMATDGDKVEIDPETYKIVNGRLYLFYNKFFTNTLSKWKESEKDYDMKAINNWKKIYK